jgi:hypothetical protein
MITAVTVNYRLPDITRRCVESIRRHAPEVSEIIVVDGTEPDPPGKGQVLPFRDDRVTTIELGINLFHGPGLDVGIHRAKNPEVLVCDNDAIILEGGLIPYLRSCLPVSAQWLAVGAMIRVDDKGYLLNDPEGGYPCPEGGWKYPHPQCMLIDREVYLDGKPFIHHGAPCLDRFKTQQELLFSAPMVPQMIHHEFKGTWRTPEYRKGL